MRELVFVLVTITVLLVGSGCQILGVQKRPNSNGQPGYSPESAQAQDFPPIPREAAEATGARADPAWRDFLVQPGDLPVLHKGGDNVISQAPALKRNFPGLRFMVTQWFDLRERDGEIGGDVWLAFYEDSESARQGYSKWSDSYATSERIEHIGEQAHIWRSNDMTGIVFVQCRAVVRVKGLWQIDPQSPRGFLAESDVIHYAQRLSERIKAPACK